MYKHIVKFAKRGKAQRHVAKLYQQKLMDLSIEEVSKLKAERIQRVVKQVTIDGEFDTQKFWKLRRSQKAAVQSCSSVIVDDTEVFVPDQIKRAYNREFEERVARPEISNIKIEELVNKTNEVLSLLIEDTPTNEPFADKELEEGLKELKRDDPSELRRFRGGLEGIRRT